MILYSRFNTNEKGSGKSHVQIVYQEAGRAVSFLFGMPIFYLINDILIKKPF